MNETNELTKIGIDNLIYRIVNREVKLEEAMTTPKLNAWLNGYAQCQADVLDIIDEMRGELDC